MTVPSKPLPQLLDRELARAKAREIVGDLLETTEDMANEGTQLLSRLLSEAARVNPRRRSRRGRAASARTPCCR